MNNIAPSVFADAREQPGRDLRLVYAIRVTSMDDGPVQPAIDAALAGLKWETTIGKTERVRIDGVTATATIVGYSQRWDFPELQELDCPK